MTAGQMQQVVGRIQALTPQAKDPKVKQELENLHHHHQVRMLPLKYEANSCKGMVRAQQMAAQHRDMAVARFNSLREHLQSLPPPPQKAPTPVCAPPVHLLCSS